MGLEGMRDEVIVGVRGRGVELLRQARKKRFWGNPLNPFEGSGYKGFENGQVKIVLQRKGILNESAAG